MSWSSDDINILIREVEKKPNLYDKSNSFYKNKRANHNSFLDINHKLIDKSRKFIFL